MNRIRIRPKELAEELGVSRSTLWRWSHIEGFPRPSRLGPPGSRCVGYLKSDVEAWMANRGAC